MKLNALLSIMLLATAASCGQNRQPQPQANESSPPPAVRGAPTPPADAPPPTPLPEPTGPIDPKSVEAAGQVVQRFGALIEQRSFVEAEKLWGDATAAASFEKSLEPNTHLEIGELGETEGAAGSIYTTVPVVFYGDGFRRPANVILRRINDVPGSTAEQRRWHIERIDWTS